MKSSAASPIRRTENLCVPQYPVVKSRSPYLWLGGAMSLYAAVFLAYSQSLAFTLDEGYHLLAAQLIGAGRTPYLDFC